MAKHVVVVGGGFGGLSAALHLSARGHRVTLLERSGMLGGKASRFARDGFSFDTGPSLVTMPEILDELFASVGEKREELLPLVRLDPQCRYFFADGRSVDLCDARRATLDRIAAFAPGEEGRFGRALDQSRKIYDTIGAPFLAQPMEGMASLIKAFASSPFSSLRFGALQGAIGDFSRQASAQEQLQWIVQRYATYAGGGPLRTPAAFAMILHIETAMGAWYPLGGVHSIVRAMQQVLEKRGVTLRLISPVESISVEKGRVTGVVVNGRTEPCDAVVVNADPVTTARHLLAPELVRRSGLDRHLTQELGLSGAVLMLGVRGRLDHLAHHTVLFPRQYREEMSDLFEQHRAPLDPTVYLCIPSRTDPTRAPSGDESLFCMINAPAFDEATGPKETATELIQRIKRVVERVVPDLRQRIAVEEFIGPADLKRRLDAPGGSIYGVSPHGTMAPFVRPRQQVRGVRGLTFAGGGTHPGGGIPLVIRSGRFAAELLEPELSR
jgi:phytoene desaturase